MATLQLVPLTAIGGATFAAAQLIFASVSSDRQKLILPKVEPASTASAAAAVDAASLGSRGCGWSSCGPAAAAAKLAEARAAQRKRKATAAAAAGVQRSAGHGKPASVSRRNARERNRVKQVNQGFVTLANHVPPSMRPKKMSKVETLRAAIKYISYLYDAVEQKPPSDVRSSHRDDDDERLAAIAAAAASADAAAGRPTDNRPRPCEDARPRGGPPSQPTSSSASSSPPPPPRRDAAFGATVGERLASALAANFDLPTCLLSPASSAYDAPSPSGSVGSSRSSVASGSASETEGSYESCLSPSSEELLDFASWFCTHG